MNKHIQSIEVFPSLAGKYDSIENFPEELLDLIFEYVEENKITVKIKESHTFMKKVYKICEKYNIRCQKYIFKKS